MKITYPTDAPSNVSNNEPSPVKWHAIIWQNVNRNVRRLQIRIVKAMQAGKRHKVRSLQRLLVRSMSGKALAVRRVTENQGKRTAGVDGLTWNTPAQKEKGMQRLGVRPYQAQPLRRIYIPKSNGKRRPLGIPTMQDRAEQALHLLALAPVAETTGDSHSYGFRTLRTAQDAIAQCFNVLSRRTSPQWILEADIAACFDNIDHQWLLKEIPIDKVRLRAWLKAGYIQEYTRFPTEKGTPQGGIISPTLANMTLDGLQALIREHVPISKVHFIRYADDFIITAPDKEILECQIIPLLRSFLQPRGLALSEEKTIITHIEQGFDFLGKHIRKYNGKLLIKPSKKSQLSLLYKVRSIIKTEGPRLSAASLIHRLNPIIRGWANYHRHHVSTQAFHSLDFRIHHMLWRWAKRRHSNKSCSWIRERYFKPHHASRSQFQQPASQSSSSTLPRKLFLASDLKIQRYVKVRQHLNPYDPQWEIYSEQRLFKSTQLAISHKPLFLRLWQRQLALCPLCQQPLSSESNHSWEVHHILHKSNGGSDDFHNLLLLHPTCHRQLHHPDFHGSLPRFHSV